VLAAGTVNPGFPSPSGQTKDYGVMVRVLASGAVYPGFPSPSGQTKDYNIDMCCFSTEHAVLMIKNKDWLTRNQGNVCPSVATCLSTNRCFSELEL
jgi:hypothetical protein